MHSVLTPTAPKKAARHWDGISAVQRLKMILDHEELFWSLGLVTNSEINVVQAMSEGSREYIVNREDQPIFTSINLKKNFAGQTHREKLEAAINAVFLKKLAF